MNTVEKLYELIKKDNSINTLNNNKDLFLDFVYHYMSIQYNGLKVIDIYKYILSLNLADDNEFLPYINSKIMDDFNNYEQYLLFSPFMNKFKLDDNYIELIIKLINDYSFFSKYEDNTLLDKLIDNHKFIRDYTSSMIVILNSSFFLLSKENIKILINHIKNNEYLKNTINNGLGDCLLDKDYIFEYCSRYLFTNEFINYDSYKDDILLKSLKEGKIKDKELLKRIIKNTHIAYLVEVFDLSISNFIDMLDSISNDDLFKVIMFNQVLTKIIEEEYYTLLLDFIIDDNRVNKYLTKEQIDKIIKKNINDYPTDLTDKQVLFLLNYSDDLILKINIKENLKDNKFSEESKKILIDSTKDIKDYNLSFKSAIGILDGMFKGKKIDSITCFLCMKALIKEYLKDDKIKVYLSRDSNSYGSANYNDYSITINLDHINKLVSYSNYESNPEALHILDTIFHELKHILQFKKMDSSDIDEDTYDEWKEVLLRQISTGYYKKNYIGINYEKEARVVGARTLSNLLNNYFPYLVNCIKYYKDLVLYEQSIIYDDKEIFELSYKVSTNDAIDKLVMISPSIVSNYPLLKREYDLDGNKKNMSVRK